MARQRTAEVPCKYGENGPCAPPGAGLSHQSILPHQQLFGASEHRNHNQRPWSMSERIENRAEREMMWLPALLPKLALIQCNYHLASTQIRCKHRFIKRGFTDDRIAPNRSNHLPISVVVAKVNLSSSIATPRSNLRLRV
jgi:hypothetical protein